MSEAMDNYLDRLRKQRRETEAARQEKQENADPGFLATMFANLASGYGNMGASLLKGVGAQINALDETGRESSVVDSIRNGTSNTLLGDLGKWMVDTGDEWQRGSQNVQSAFGTRKKYADLDLTDRVTTPEYWTDPRGAWADVMQGTGSSIPFLALSAIAPEVTIGSRAIGALSNAPGLLGRGFSALGSKGAGAAVDKMLSIGATTAPLDAFTNASEIYDELKAQGLSDTEAAAKIREAALEELPYDFLNSAIFGGVVSGRLGRALAGGANANLGRRIAGGLGTIPIEMGSEYAQESMQQRMTNEYTGKPTGTWYKPSPEEAAAGAAGAIGALLPAIGGAAHTAYTGGEDEIPNPFTGNRNGRVNRGNASATESVTSTSDLTADEISRILSGSQQGTGTPNVSGAQGRPSQQGTSEQVQQEYAPQTVSRRNGSGEGTTWVKQTGNVSLDGAKEETLEALELLADWFYQRTGKPLILTAGTNGSHPSNGSATGHDAGWKLDVNDWGSGAEGTLLGENDGEKGTLTDEFIAYGQSLGLGMNWEDDHIDVSAAGEQWEGPQAGANFGGLKLGESSGVQAASNEFTKGSGNPQYDSWIQQYSAQYGVPANLLTSLIEVESGFNPEAVSDAGAIGIAQFMPETAEGFGIDPHDPEQSIMAAAQYLRGNYDKFGDWHKALEAYNGGPNGVGTQETMAYADKVLDGAGNISQTPSNTDSAGNAIVPAGAAAPGTQGVTADSDSLSDIIGQLTQQGQGPSDNVRAELLRQAFGGADIDPGRIQAERDNIRDMHYKQLAGDEASSGIIPHLDREVNTDYAKAAGNMAMAGFQGANGWERGQLGAALEKLLQNPATAQQAQEIIRQMQAEDEASYFAGDVHTQEGVGKSRKSVLIRSKDGGLTKEAQQKYFQSDWQNFADREGYRGGQETAPHKKQGAEAIEDIRERLVSAKSSAADNGNKQLVDEINKALRTGDESSMREIANRLSGTPAQNTLTATHRGENVNENQNAQTTTTTPQKGEEAPTNQNQDTEPGQGAAQNEVRNPPRNTTTKANEPVLSGDDRLLRDAFSPIPNTASGRAKQSKAIRVLARQHNVSFPDGVVRGMELGYPAAIATAQAHLSNAGVAIPEGLGVDSRSKIPVPEAAPMQNLPQRSIPVDETVENNNVASQATNEGGEKSVQNAATETTSQNGAGEVKEGTRKETPSKEVKAPQNEPQEARGANEEKRGESKHQTTQNESDTVKKEYKYYMNERGVSPGAQPKGFTRFDEEDKGGRYGAIYYDHPLTEKEIADYELTSANQDESQEQVNEKHHREKAAQNEGNKKSADEGGKRLFSVSSTPQNQKTSNQKPTGKHSETRGAFSVTYDSGKHLAKLESKAQKNLIDELSTLTKNMGGTANKGKKTFTFKDMESLNQFLDCANAYMSITDPETMAKLSITAWHGSPHKFDNFSLQSIGTGEGGQVHGWGLYFAQDRGVSEGYRIRLGKEASGTLTINGEKFELLPGRPGGFINDKGENKNYIALALKATDGNVDEAIKYAEKQNWGEAKRELEKNRDNIQWEYDNGGSLFQVEIPDEDVMLDEQKKLSEQPEKVRNLLEAYAEEIGDYTFTFDEMDESDTGRSFYRYIIDFLGSPKAASEYLNKAGVKGITYDGRQDGRCYVVFDDQAIDIIGKFSANDEIRKILDGIKIVDNEELNSQQEKFSALGNELGCQIVWIDADPRLNGMHIPGTNVTLLNRKAGMSLQKTFWHETFHWIKANNAPLWEELLTYFKGKTAFTKEQIDSYREKYGRYDLQRDEDVIEELLADAFVDVKQRVPLMQEMAKENPSLAKKFVAWLKRMMDRFVEVFHNPEGKLTTAQRDQFVEAFGRLAASMVDGNKKKLFKTYNNGKRITFLDGEPLPELQFSRRSRFSAFDVDFDEIKDVRKKYEGTGQWMKAPNGKKTNLTEAQWLAVRTKAFKKWFGDWENNPDSASKIIDENGEPMPVAHGTNESFSRFDKGRVGSNTGNYGHLGYGFYFSTDVDEASGYGNNTMSLFLNIRKPFEGDEQSLEKYSDILDLGETDTVLDRDSIKKALKQKSSIAYQFVKNLEKGGYEEAWERACDNEEVQHDEELQELLDDVARYWDRAGSETYTEEDIERISKVFGKNITSHKRLHISPLPYLLNTGAYKDQTEAFTKALQTDGYDGVIYGSEIVAFEPKQIKSATDNVGTFSTESDNIKYSFAGENAENAPLDRLERAKEMDGKANPDKIYEETGWFKGKDGKWRFEIPDNLNKINFDRLEKSKAGSMYYTLGEIYDNPKLYEAYPDLIRVLVGKEEGMGTVNGQVRYDKGEPIIVLNADKLNQPSMKTTLIHEIQHVIQQKEGFAAGGSPKSVRYQIRERIHDILKKLRKLDNANELIGRYQAMNKAFFDYIENPDVDKEMEMRRESDRLANEYEFFAATLPKKLSDEVIGLWNQKQNLMDALKNGSDFELYRNLGGEQEAREVARRSEGATRLSKQNSDTQEAEKALNDALEDATENQMKAYRNREKLDKEIRKQGGRPTEEQLEKMESYDKAMGETLSEAYDNYLWERDTADEMKEEMGTPTPHNDDAIIVFSGKEFAMSNENDVDNSENIRDNESRETDPEIAKATERALFARYISANKRRELENGIKVDVARAKRSGTPIVRDSLRTINKMVDLFNAIPKKDSQRTNREMLATQIEYARRCFENEYSSDGRSEREDNGGYSSLGRGKASPYAGNLRDTSGQSAEASGKVQGEKAVIVDGERDDAKNFWRETFDREYKHQQDIRKGASTRTNASASSMPKNQDSTAGTKFSINASDNSTPSLAHRIKNILAGTPATAQAKEQYRRRMARMIEDALGIKIRTGKMDVGRPANGTVIYKPNDKVIRSLHAYDWENILPVASGLMAERLGIVEKAADTSEAMRNYISTWILTGATNNTSAEADTFHKAMREQPHFADSMLAIREQFQDWADKSVQDQMRKSVQWSKEKTSTWKERKNLLYEELVEELAPLEDMVKQYEKETGEKIEASLNPMTAFRLLRGAHGRAITMIEGVGKAAVDGLKANFPNVKFDGFKTLHTILNDIGALQNQEKQQDFATYCIAKHILDMHHKNRKNRLEQEKLEYQVEGMKEQVKEDTEKVKGMKEQMALYQGEMNELRKLERRIESNKNKIKEAEKQIETLKDSIYETPEAFTEENCEKYIRDAEEEYGQAQKDLVHFSNTTAAILADSGVISNKRYQELLKSWPNYVPLFRVFEENKDIDFGDSMKRIKGSMRDIVNPLESIVHNTVEFVKKAEKNKAKSLLADFARCDGTGWLVEEVDNNSPNTETVITFYENGQRKYLETDPSIVKAVNNMDRTNSNAVMKFLHAVTSVARACFTMASPEFAFRNIFRDYADAFVYNKFGFISPMDLARGFMHAWRRDNVYYEWLSSGAAQASAVSLDRNYTQEMIDKLSRSMSKRAIHGAKDVFLGAWTATRHLSPIKGIGQSYQGAKSLGSVILEGLQKGSEYSEYATRIAMYEKAKGKLSKGRARQDAMNALIGAAFESRDLMDFSRHGKAGAFWNQLVPFANASIQGMNKFYRTFDFRNGNKKEVMRATARLLIFGGIIPTLLFLMHHDDDWFKELPDWVKETHYVFKIGDTIIRIPKGSDVGIRFLSNAVEKSMAQVFNHDRVKATEYFMPLYDALPNFLPIAILPLLEASLNRSTFTGRNIVPQYQEKFTPKMQYGPYTTGMAKFLGEKLGIAPSKIDHVIAGYTGSVGMAPWKFLDVLAGDRQLDTSITELPLTRALTYMPYKNPQSVQKYYEALDEQTKLKNEFDLTHKRPEGFDPALLMRLKDVKKKMSELSKRERDAINNPNLSLEERKKRQFAIQQQRIKLVERVLK